MEKLGSSTVSRMDSLHGTCSRASCSSLPTPTSQTSKDCCWCTRSSCCCWINFMQRGRHQDGFSIVSSCCVETGPAEKNVYFSSVALFIVFYGSVSVKLSAVISRYM